MNENKANLSNPYFPRQIAILLSLAVPLMLTGFVESLPGFFATIFVAKLGVNELAASSIVARTFVTLMVIAWGILSSVSIIVAQKHGEQDNDAIAKTLRDGLLLAFILTIPAMLLLWNIGPLLKLAGQDALTIQIAVVCMHGLVWGMFPDFVGLVLMQLLIGLGHTRSSMVFSMLKVPIMIFTTYAFMFGKLGFPLLGIAGIGWGPTLTYWILSIVLILYFVLHKTYRHYFRNLLPLTAPVFLKELWRIGIPMGSMYCAELAYFLVITLLIGRFGNNQLAGNQIAVQYLMLLSAATFAIAQAVTVRMGHTLGAKETQLAENTCYIGVVIAVGFMFIVALFYWFLPDWLIGLNFNLDSPNNKGAIYYARHFLAIAALFQLLEAVRFVMFGALRSLRETRYSLLVSITSFWMIALPVGYFLATKLNMEGLGLWWGMVLGAMTSALLLSLRFKYKMKSEYIILHPS